MLSFIYAEDFIHILCGFTDTNPFGTTDASFQATCEHQLNKVQVFKIKQGAIAFPLSVSSSIWKISNKIHEFKNVLL